MIEHSEILIADDNVADVVDPSQLGPDFLPDDRPRPRVSVLELLGVPRLLSITDVARRLGVCSRTVYNFMRDPSFPRRRRRVGGRLMFLSTDIDNYLRNLEDEDRPRRPA